MDVVLVVLVVFVVIGQQNSAQCPPKQALCASNQRSGQRPRKPLYWKALRDGRRDDVAGRVGDDKDGAASRDRWSGHGHGSDNVGTRRVVGAKVIRDGTTAASRSHKVSALFAAPKRRGGGIEHFTNQKIGVLEVHAGKVAVIISGIADFQDCRASAPKDFPNDADVVQHRACRDGNRGRVGRSGCRFGKADVFGDEQARVVLGFLHAVGHRFGKGAVGDDNVRIALAGQGQAFSRRDAGKLAEIWGKGSLHGG